MKYNIKIVNDSRVSIKNEWWIKFFIDNNYIKKLNTTKKCVTYIDFEDEIENIECSCCGKPMTNIEVWCWSCGANNNNEEHIKETILKLKNEKLKKENDDYEVINNE